MLPQYAPLHTQHRGLGWRSEDTWQGRVSPSPTWYLRITLRSPRLGSRWLYSLNHLTSPAQESNLKTINVICLIWKNLIYFIKYYNINSSFKQISTIRNEKFNNGHFVYIHVCKNNKFAINKTQIILKMSKEKIYIFLW